MKKFSKAPGKNGTTTNHLARLLLMLLMVWGSINTHAQTIGIIQGLTPVTPRAGQPFNGSPTVEFPILITPAGDYYANRFYKFDTDGKLVDIGAVPKGYDASNNGWSGYCVQCLTSDFPQIYRAVTLNCYPGSVIAWKPDPYSDPAIGVSTNNCTASEAWSNPLTWSDYKVPNPATGGFNINRNVTLDVNYDATNKAIYCNNGSALTINSGVTLTSNSGGSFVNNGTIKAEGQYGTLVNNGVVSPGTNGIGQFQGGKYTQNASGTLDMQLASTNSFDKLYFTSGVSVLGGTLKVSLLNGFVPVQNNSFNIIEMSYGTYTGTFSNLDVPPLPNGLKWQVSYNPTDVRLTIVEIPCAGLAVTITAGGNTNLCFGNSVVLTANPANATSPSYQWYQDGIAISGATGTTYSANATGSYTVTVSSNTCSATSAATIVNASSAITSSVSAQTNVKCFGTATGSATVSAGGGTGGYTYLWSPSGGNAATATGLLAGNYTVTITDANGCSKQQAVVISQPASTLTALCQTSNDNILYFGYAGDQSQTFTITPSGGIAPYSIRFTMSRAILCNQINAAGNEVWTAAAGGNTTNECGTIPISVKSNATSYAVTVTLMKDADIIVTVTDANGCTYMYSKHIHAEDVRCFAGSSNNAKVMLCHKTGSSSNPCKTICVSEDAVAAHLAHGDFLGNCTPNCIAPVYARPINNANNAIAGLLDVKVMNNPSVKNSPFILKITSPNPNNEIKIKVMDLTGKLVEYKAAVRSGQTVEMGRNYATGLYIIEVSQGHLRKLVKVLKTN